MQLSDQGYIALALFEGVKLHAYNDTADKLTIGVGHLITKDELVSGQIRIGDEYINWYESGLTKVQAMELLHRDLIRFEEIVSKLALVKLSQQQFDALVIFAFNVGVSAFKNSTLLRLLNSGDYDAVPAQLNRWIYAGKKEDKGLKNRRAKEIKIWKGEYDI